MSQIAKYVLWYVNLSYIYDIYEQQYFEYNYYFFLFLSSRRQEDIKHNVVSRCSWCLTQIYDPPGTWL